MCHLWRWNTCRASWDADDSHGEIAGGGFGAGAAICSAGVPSGSALSKTNALTGDCLDLHE